MSPKLEPLQERHLLILEDDRGCRSVALDAATHSIGRDQTNGIMLHSKTVSRQHALLLRLPMPETAGYRYRIVDGNSLGKPSVNGISVNGQRCTSFELKSGDEIQFGAQVRASYQMLKMGEREFLRYLEQTNYQSIKSEPINAFATLVGVEEELEELEELTSITSGSRVQEPELKSSFWDVLGIKSQPLRYALVATLGMVTGLSIGGGILIAFGLIELPQNAMPATAKPSLK